MKRTLQLIVVVLISPTKFRDNLQQFVQIHSIYNNNIQGRKHKHCNFTGTVLWYYHRAWVTCGISFSDKALTDFLKRQELPCHDNKYEYFWITQWWQIEEVFSLGRLSFFCSSFS